MSETKKGIAALVILAFVFATMGVFARYLGTEFALFEQTYLRIGLAFLFGIILFARDLRVERLGTLPRKDALVLIGRAVALYLGVVLFTEAVLHAKYGNASFIATIPLLPLFGYVFLKEKLGLRTLAYIGVGFAGMALIAVQDLRDLQFGYGELMALLSAFAFDISYVARRFHSDHLNNKESTVFMFFFGALFLFITSLALGEPLPNISEFSPILLFTLAGASLFNVANLYLTNYGFERVKVGIAGNILTLEVVFALLYGILLFHEMPLLRELVGGALIVFSVYQINRKEK